MINWYEIWGDCGMSPPYLLLLHADGDAYSVLDPQERGDVIFQAGDYESAKVWLLEDEYERLSARFGNE